MEKQLSRSATLQALQSYAFAVENMPKSIKSSGLNTDDDEITPEENRYYLQLAQERKNDKKVSREEIMSILDA